MSVTEAQDPAVWTAVGLISTGCLAYVCGVAQSRCFEIPRHTKKGAQIWASMRFLMLNLP